MKKIFVNLKDWFDLEENREFAENIQSSNIVIFPSMPYLYIYSNLKNIELGSQDVSAFDIGAHTGSVNVKHLKNFNIGWAILNHNELKIESFDILYNKIVNCLENNVKVILCINDVDERELSILKRLAENIENFNEVYIAYETIKEMDINTIRSNIETIKKFCKETLGYVNPIIYGGNINSENIQEYSSTLNIDGILISRGALDIDKFKTIIKVVK